MIKARVCWLTPLGILLDSAFVSREIVLIYSNTFKEVMYFSKVSYLFPGNSGNADLKI